MSVINAPLTSKLRKQDKKAHKKKSAKDTDAEHNLLAKFVPYISKISRMLSENA